MPKYGTGAQYIPSNRGRGEKRHSRTTRNQGQRLSFNVTDNHKPRQSKGREIAEEMPISLPPCDGRRSNTGHFAIFF